MKICKREHTWDNGKYRQCPECQQISNTKSRKKWRNNNLNKARKYANTWSQENPEKVLNSRLKTRYGIDFKTYETLVKNQEGKCAICLIEPIKAIDHCHNTEIVSGLLCRACNLMIGFARDNPEILRNGAEYLENK